MNDPMRHKTYAVIGLLLGVIVLVLVWFLADPVSAAPLEAPEQSRFFSRLNQEPTYNWRVCADLGVGVVPGLGIRRQRFRLCHNQGWQVLAYCLQPARPAPAIGTRCSRVNANTFWCGNGIQNLRTYRVEETPTPTPTTSGTPAPTGTPTPTTTPIPRGARPGSPGIIEWLSQAAQQVVSAALGNVSVSADVSGTPTPTPQIGETQPASPQTDFYGIDFSDNKKWIRIQIIPPNKQVNKGKPITIAFIPGRRCKFGDNRACVVTYQPVDNIPVTLISVHSGVGGEAQKFRSSVEGTGLARARYSLKKIQGNLQALEGAEVVIIQGKKRFEGFTLAGTTRIPAKWVKYYYGLPMDDTVEFATKLNSELATITLSNQPLLVFETCGWKIPNEPGSAGLSSTSASIYMGFIQKKP